MKAAKTLSLKHGFSLSDNELIWASSPEDLEAAYQRKNDREIVKGRPLSELFHMQELPANVEIYNYTKRRWGKKYIL